MSRTQQVMSQTLQQQHRSKKTPWLTLCTIHSSIGLRVSCHHTLRSSSQLPALTSSMIKVFNYISGDKSVGPLFGRVLRPQTLWRQCGGHAYFPLKNGIFSKKHEDQDFSSPIFAIFYMILLTENCREYVI